MKYLNHRIIFYFIREIPEHWWILASEQGRSSTIRRFEQCVLLISLVLLTVGLHEKKFFHPFIELPCGDSGCNAKNCSRIWWLGIGILTAVHMIWYDPERWWNGGSRCCPSEEQILACSGCACKDTVRYGPGEKKRRLESWRVFQSHVLQSQEWSTPCVRTRQRSEQAYRNELRPWQRKQTIGVSATEIQTHWASLEGQGQESLNPPGVQSGKKVHTEDFHTGISTTKGKPKKIWDIMLVKAGDLVKWPRYSMITSCWSILLRAALKSCDSPGAVGKLSVEDLLLMQEDQIREC